MSTPYFEVESIIGRKVFSGKVLYLTKWKNFPLEEATWESVKVLKNYRHLIRNYNDKHRQQYNNSLEINDFQLPFKQEELSSSLCQNFSNHQISKAFKEEPQEEKTDKPALEEGDNAIVIPQKSKLLIKVPTVKKRRGRPPKKLEEKAIKKQIQQVACQYEIKPQKVENIFSTRELDKETDDGMQNQNENGLCDLKKLVRILLISNNTLDNEVSYVVQDKKGNLSRCTTKQLLKLDPEMLVHSLEKALLANSHSAVIS